MQPSVSLGPTMTCTCESLFRNTDDHCVALFSAIAGTLGKSESARSTLQTPKGRCSRVRGER